MVLQYQPPSQNLFSGFASGLQQGSQMAQQRQQMQRAKQLAQQQEMKRQIETAGMLSKAVLEADPSQRDVVYRALLKKAGGYGIDTSELPEQYTPEMESELQGYVRFAGMEMPEETEYGKIPEGYYLDKETKRVSPYEGLPPKEVKAEKPPTGYKWTGEGNLQAIEGGPATKLSDTAAKTLTITTQGKKSLTELESTIEKLGGTISIKTAYGLTPIQTESEQKFNTLVNDLSDSIGRLRSGGAINEDEAKNFKRLLPRFGDKPQTIKHKIKRLKEVFKSVSSNIEKGKIVPKEQGYSEEDTRNTTQQVNRRELAIKELKRRGAM